MSNNHLKGRKRAVVAISKEGKEYHFESASEGGRVLGCHRSDICRFLHGNCTYLVGGYVWKYAEETEFDAKVFLKHHRIGKKRPVRGIYQDGRIYKEYASAKEASRELKFADGAIHHFVSGRHKYLPAGLQWEFIDDPRITKGELVFA